MSSHHFVREFQEPAVFFHSFRSEDMEKIGPLLEWAPYIIAEEQCMVLLQEYSVKVDALITFSEATAGDYPMDPRIRTLHLEDKHHLKETLSGLLPSESVGLHIIDTRETLSPTFVRDWPAGFALLYHAHVRWMRIKSSGYRKWWPKGTKIQLLSELETSPREVTEEYVVPEDGFWERAFDANSIQYLAEPYFSALP
jgi:thiamine pyrophosphokinase